MALLPHSFFPRSSFDMNQWLRPFDSGLTTMDLFDPFDELDQTLGNNFHWLTKPESMLNKMVPRFPQKYRVVVDCAGYDPKSIKTEFSGRKLTVIGREEHVKGKEDFHKKEFKKVYELPVNAEPDKLVSFMTPTGNFVIDVPLKETTNNMVSDLMPKITETTGGGKEVSLNVFVPENIDPSKVHVSIKDRDLIIRAEDRVEKPDGFTRFHYYKRSTLPENTDFNTLKCHYEHGKITITAPLTTEHKPFRMNVPIDYAKGQQQHSIGTK